MHGIRKNEINRLRTIPNHKRTEAFWKHVHVEIFLKNKNTNSNILTSQTQKNIAQLKTLNSIEHAWNSEEPKLQSAHGTEKHEKDAFRNTFSC